MINKLKNSILSYICNKDILITLKIYNDLKIEEDNKKLIKERMERQRITIDSIMHHSRQIQSVSTTTKRKKSDDDYSYGYSYDNWSNYYEE